MRKWNLINTAPQDVEIETKIDDENGERNVTNLVMKVRVPGKTRPMFWTPDGVTYVYYQPTHWRHTS